MQSQTLHSRSGRVMSIAGILFAGLGIISLGFESWELVLTKSWVYLWLAFVSWLLFWNPSVRVTEHSVVIDNIFRVHTISWPAIKRIDTKYSLSLETHDGTIRAFAAPAPSRYAGFMANRTEAEHLPESSFIGKGLVRPGDLTSSDSGVAAFLIRSHWEKLRDTNRLEGTPEISRRFIYWRVIILAVLTVAALIGFTL